MIAISPSALFGFGSADFQTDALQNLNLRSVLGGGLGFHAINSDRTTLDFLGGLNYTKESYIGLDRNFAALTLGEELMHKLGASTVLSGEAVLLPRSQRHRRVPRHFQSGDDHENQQMAGMAKCLR